jgi:hypothetical protein
MDCVGIWEYYVQRNWMIHILLLLLLEQYNQRHGGMDMQLGGEKEGLLWEYLSHEKDGSVQV